MKMSRHKFILAVAWIVTGCMFQPSRAADLSNSGAARECRDLPNGIYLILQEVDDRAKLQPVSEQTKVLLYDYHFFDPSERGEPSYVAISQESFIPIIPRQSPTKEKDANGRPKLMLELAESQVAPLEEFTRKNCNKSIAIVIGGQVVTTHKIREPIVGGKMQITRCSDHGCDVLYTQLQGGSKKEAAP